MLNAQLESKERGKQISDVGYFLSDFSGLTSYFFYSFFLISDSRVEIGSSSLGSYLY